MKVTCRDHKAGRKKWVYRLIEDNNIIVKWRRKYDRNR